VVPFGSYQLLQIKRQPTEAERRQADVLAGEMAAAVHQLRRSFTRWASAFFDRCRPRRSRFVKAARAEVRPFLER
jgi:hypothetical protein